MPQTTPEIKVEAVRALGAEVILAGDSYADAKARCDELVRETGRVFVHPFDDPLVIAGQGTIAQRDSAPQARRRRGDLRARRRRRPHRRHCQLRQGAAARASASSASSRTRPTRCTSRSRPAGGSRSIASGSSPTASPCARSASSRSPSCRRPSTKSSACRTTRSARRSRTCSTTRARSWSRRARWRSPACDRGSSARAARDARLVAILSGANMNFDRLRFVAERAEVGEAREALFGVTIPERAGRVPRVLRHDRPPRRDRVQLPAERPRPRPHLRRHRDAVAAGCRRPRSDADQGRLPTRSSSPTTRSPSCTCATWSAAAAPKSPTSCVCRFEFPERPGALMTFLDKLGGRWNISLFHYRNHGADFGRVLAGFEVPPADTADFQCVPRRPRLPLSARTRQLCLRHVPCVATGAQRGQLSQ